MLDIDAGLEGLPDYSDFCVRHDLPATYTVRTGRRPGYGVQAYFTGLGLKSIAWQDGELSGDIRCATGYVTAEGSVHPSGERYERIGSLDYLEPVPAYVRTVPPAIKTWLPGMGNAAVEDDGGDITMARNNHMVHLLGKARAAGADDDTIRSYAVEVNEKRMVPPLGKAELDRIIANVCKYPIPDNGPEVLIGGKLAGKAETVADAVAPAEPVDWRKHYHTFEEMETAPPAEFLIRKFLQKESITALAAPVGQRKSLIALNIAHALCTGEPLFGRFEVVHRPTRVLYLCPEMGMRSFADRTRRIGLMGEVGKTLFVRTMNKEGHVTLDDLTEDELDGAVVIIDTAVRYLEGDESSSEDMSKFAKSIFRLQQKDTRHGAVCVLLLHHSAKGTKEAPELTLENALRGSGEIGAFVTSCWATRLQDPDDEYNSASYLRNVKQRDFKSKAFAVVSAKIEGETDEDGEDVYDMRLRFVEGSVGAVLKGKSAFKGNKDGKDEAALALIAANPDLSISKLVQLLEAHDIPRKREWIRQRKPKVVGTGVDHTS